LMSLLAFESLIGLTCSGSKLNTPF
jgi:hypothetical protein